MKIFTAALLVLYKFLATVVTKELTVNSSLEGKIIRGLKPNEDIVDPMFYNIKALYHVMVQLVEPDLKPICAGVRLVPYQIIVSGACIEPYRNFTNCGGILVKFEEEYYHILKCVIRGETTDIEDENHGRDHYNDIGVIFLRLKNHPTSFDLLQQGENGFIKGSTTFLLGWNKNTTKVLILENSDIGRRCVGQVPKRFDTDRIFCAVQAIKYGFLEKIDMGSPIFRDCKLLGIVSGRFQPIARPKEIIFSSYSAHYDYIQYTRRKYFYLSYGRETLTTPHTL